MRTVTEHEYCWSADALGSYPGLHREPRFLKCKCRCGGMGLVRRLLPSNPGLGPYWRTGSSKHLFAVEVVCSDCGCSTGKYNSACGAIERWNTGNVVRAR